LPDSGLPVASCGADRRFAVVQPASHFRSQVPDTARNCHTYRVSPGYNP
jgi:hypothetical protein